MAGVVPMNGTFVGLDVERRLRGDGGFRGPAAAFRRRG